MRGSNDPRYPWPYIPFGSNPLHLSQKHYQFLQNLETSQFIILLDNLGLVHSLHSGQTTCKASQNLIFQILELLQSLKSPFHIDWLRRSNPHISFADSLQRTALFDINPSLRSKLECFFKTKFFIPEIFLKLESIPLILPQHLIRTLDSPDEVPLLVLPPNIPKITLDNIILCFRNQPHPIIIGMPKFRWRLIHKYILEPNFKIDKIDSRNFQGSLVSDKHRKNFPYFFGFLRQSNSIFLHI